MACFSRLGEAVVLPALRQRRPFWRHQLIPCIEKPAARRKPISEALPASDRGRRGIAADAIQPDLILR
jgi:hypothetical protein